ncbi:hypothetical protein [uncultured Polaribacter sp.]|uniref:hypothetical protein n=1 Tax=uncultured Polaribacter sp. TaxID=174711 RepID=UPI0026094127|nr:hypothetical protein [uncultured Polaribacter sp.]
MFKKIILFSLLMFAIQAKAVNSVLGVVKFDKVYQDKTILIQKIKAKIKALNEKREKLQSLKKWTPEKEKVYQKQVASYTNSLRKLGVNYIKKLHPDAIIRKLQKELKYINNARINKNAREDGLSDRYDSIYKKKAQILIDSIIKLRSLKPKTID